MGLRTEPTQRQRRLGVELRRLREASGVTTAEACRAVGLHKPHLSHIEAGRTACPEPRLHLLLDTYGCRDTTLRTALIRLTKATGKGWWTEFRDVIDARGRDLAELEDMSDALRTFEWLFVPGLLQTPAYMRELYLNRAPETAPADLDQHITFRLGRHRILTEGRCSLHAVIHEAAFHMHFVSRTTMREQLEHIVAMAELPHVSVQFLPFRAGTHPAGPCTAFALHSHPSGALHTVHVEQVEPLFLTEPEQVENFSTDFARLATVALRPLHEGADRTDSSIALAQHLRYIL